ncbi:40S ribosomal protein S3a [Camelus dromedarius]|uniref:40S ribosomal protein S3a n=1 Tax=Camelus dromedarius TaxID=9838 RepID=A0A5N4D298_CAMDR|nr:40S ribosomal protein S3a [Camelus dromedarius]
MAMGKNKHLVKSGKKIAKKKVNDEVALRKFKLIIGDIHGQNCLTNFCGMDLTCDRLCSKMVKRWQAMLEAHVDVKTTSGYLLHLFHVGFTKICNSHIWKPLYAKKVKNPEAKCELRKLTELHGEVSSWKRYWCCMSCMLKLNELMDMSH